MAPTYYAITYYDIEHGGGERTGRSGVYSKLFDNYENAYKFIGNQILGIFDQEYNEFTSDIIFDDSDILDSDILDSGSDLDSELETKPEDPIKYLIDIEHRNIKDIQFSIVSIASQLYNIIPPINEDDYEDFEDFERDIEKSFNNILNMLSYDEKRKVIYNFIKNEINKNDYIEVGILGYAITEVKL